MKDLFLCLVIAAGSVQGRAAVTYTEHIQPLLKAKCGSCHGPSTFGGAPLFTDSYAEVLRPSEHHQASCPGHSVGECIGLAVAIQEKKLEGAWCRTYSNPFHRESWICLDDAEKALVAEWIDDGLAE